MGETLLELWPGFLESMRLTGAVLVPGLLLGMLLGMGMFALPKRISWLPWAISEIGRGLPALVLLYFVYFGLPSAGLTLPAFPAIVLAFVITTAGYTAEIFRSSIASISKQQMEGAQAVGLSRWQSLWLVIVPQALKIAVLPLASFTILIFQGTSLAYSIGITELMSVAYTTGVISFDVSRYIYGAALYYLVIVLAFEGIIVLIKAGYFSRSRYKRSRTTPKNAAPSPAPARP